jgi:tetratricopeptide (TPR) repeat protein
MADIRMQKLDEQELLHLALEAIRAQQHGNAIDYLKQALEKSPSNYNAAYLLAAEHAQIGLTDRAIEGFNQTLKLQPGLASARFQLGLLFMCNGRIPEAMGTLEPMSKLGDSDPYRHFGDGLTHLCRDEIAAAEQSLKRGMQLNTANPALNGDVQKILERIAEVAGGGGPGAEPPKTDQPAHRLISAYTKTLN